jgi:hypothetical protein
MLYDQLIFSKNQQSPSKMLLCYAVMEMIILRSSVFVAALTARLTEKDFSSV